MRNRFSRISGVSETSLALLCALLVGCSASFHREEADQAATSIIAAAQTQTLGHTENVEIESPETTLRRRLLLDQQLPRSSAASLGVRDLDPVEHWPEKGYLLGTAPPAVDPSSSVSPPFKISVNDGLSITAENSREYQTRKEDLFRRALDLEFEADQFRSTFSGTFDGNYLLDRTNADVRDGVVEGFGGTTIGGITQQLKNGISMTARIGWDLARMLQPGKAASSSLFGDASISIPLLRGSGRHIVTEPLTQAERNVVYAIWDFERFKQELVVDVIDSYLSVLQSEDQLNNQEENYRGLITSSRRARRLAEAGKLPQIQVDQAIQNELRSRDRWVASRQSLERAIDQFKIQLGLPADARVELDRRSLEQIADTLHLNLEGLGTIYEQGEIPPADAEVVLTPPSRQRAGLYELEPDHAIRIALDRRLDLLTAEGEIDDALRRVVVAADRLRPELTLLGGANLGERRSVATAGRPDSNRLDFSRGRYDALVNLDLGLERTAESLDYRESFIALQVAVRNLQALEDLIKFQVRDKLRDLEESRSSLVIQFEATRLAERRVTGASLELEAGRAEMRDFLDAQESLVNAQNALTAALVRYRISELEMQRDLGILEVDAALAWREPDPGSIQVTDHD